MVIQDEHGNKTKHLNINEESAKELIEWLQNNYGNVEARNTLGHCEDCKYYYQRQKMVGYNNYESGAYGCRFLDSDYLGDRGIEIEYDALDDTGLEVGFNIGRRFGCVHFEANPNHS